MDEIAYFASPDMMLEVQPEKSLAEAGIFSGVQVADLTEAL